mmetsp:Transcript_37189/g.93355  ORF Transcript_37189/g.93355 Transcript_37189/m.93355 type:complete len:299 (-) Transcript_37189:184-1080(-)
MALTTDGPNTTLDGRPSVAMPTGSRPAGSRGRSMASPSPSCCKWWSPSSAMSRRNSSALLGCSGLCLLVTRCCPGDSTCIPPAPPAPLAAPASPSPPPCRSSLLSRRLASLLVSMRELGDSTVSGDTPVMSTSGPSAGSVGLASLCCRWSVSGTPTSMSTAPLGWSSSLLLFAVSMLPSISSSISSSSFSRSSLVVLSSSSASSAGSSILSQFSAALESSGLPMVHTQRLSLSPSHTCAGSVVSSSVNISCSHLAASLLWPGWIRDMIRWLVVRPLAPLKPRLAKCCKMSRLKSSLVS